MNDRDLETVIKESESVREAIKRGVPREAAVRVYLDANKKVESGEWVELYREEPRHGISPFHPQSTSVLRYWGPKTLLKGKPMIARSKAERLF